MTVGERVYDILSRNVALTALVPASRIRPPGDWSVGSAKPYILHRLVSGGGTYTHEGLAELKEWDFYEVAVFSDDYESGDAVARAIRDALSNYRENGFTIFWTPGPWHLGRDPDVALDHFALNFRIAETVQE